MKTMTKKEEMYQRIEKHGEDLNRIFHTPYDNITLCKKLRRLEVKGNKLALDYFNGDITGDDFEIDSNELAKKICSILGIDKNGLACYPLYINGDCRGYTFKLDDDWVKDNNISIHKDWGGYGIIAPDLS